MAQTKRRRRRKHRGTQTGRVDPRRRVGRPRNRAEAKARARSQRTNRYDVAPTWRSAFNRALVAAGIFFVLLILLFRTPVAGSVLISLFMLAVYTPLGYLTDSFFYRRRQQKKERERAQRRG